MDSSTRREFLKAGALAAAGAALPSGLAATPESPLPFGFGLASYSLRAFPLDRVIEMTKRLGLVRLTLKDMHLPLGSSEQEIASALEKVRSAGLELSSCGVVYMMNAEELRRGFAYAQRAGLTLLVGAPDASLLPLAEQCVKETGIALAIHNHGPTDTRYPSPESAYTLIKTMDPRMGLCLDMGHTMRLGLDPVHEAERFADRLLDVHIKDVTAANAGGTTVEIGRGVIDIPGFLATMKRLRYRGTLHFEFEKDERDPLPGLAESIGYVRGVLAALKNG